MMRTSRASTGPWEQRSGPAAGLLIDRLLSSHGLGPIHGRRDVGVFELEARPRALHDGPAKFGGQSEPEIELGATAQTFFARHAVRIALARHRMYSRVHALVQNR